MKGKLAAGLSVGGMTQGYVPHGRLIVGPVKEL